MPRPVGYWKDNYLYGYGVMRLCFEGYKIGPLFADNYENAQSLYEALIPEFEAGTTGIPGCTGISTTQVWSWVKRYGMKVFLQLPGCITGNSRRWHWRRFSG